MISTNQIHWIAGILEGEGSFGLTTSGSPLIRVAMTDSDVVEKIRILIAPFRSVYINQKENRKPCYHVSLSGRGAIEWMMTIYSLMGIRRKAKIREVLVHWKATEYVHRGSGKRSLESRTRQKLAIRLRNKGYSDSQVEVAKVLSASGLSDEQILSRLEELKSIGIH